ncbi:MAG: hypothetical protein KC609_16945, partial [Myxococcales bacterium]|nr:hypothetical protein [Myxococcales bacterium]
LALAGGLGLGCNTTSSPPPPGQLSVNYSLGLKSCADLDLSKIQIRLYDESGVLRANQENACSDSSKTIVVSNVVQGYYRIQIDGLNEDGISTHRGGYPDATASTKQYVLVESGKLSALNEAILLAARKGGIYLSWKFSNGDLCNFNGVADVKVIMYDENNSVIHSAKYPCDPSVLAPNPNDDVASGDYIKSKNGVYIAELNAGTTDLIVDGLSATGVRLWQSSQQFDVANGVIKEIKVTLDDCSQVTCN